jgi:hypothetical protein
VQVHHDKEHEELITIEAATQNGTTTKFEYQKKRSPCLTRDYDLTRRPRVGS